MNVAYRKVYFRIQAYAYDYGYGCNSGWSNEADGPAFEQECRSLFQDLGWTLQLGSNGVCDTVEKDRQDLYLHPTSFSGVMEEANIQPLQTRPFSLLSRPPISGWKKRSGNLRLILLKRLS